jgi:hypothetical protein
MVMTTPTDASRFRHRVTALAAAVASGRTKAVSGTAPR